MPINIHREPTIAVRLRRATLCSVLLIAGSLACARQQQPVVFLMDARTLLSAQKDYAEGGGEYQAAIRSLMKDAERAMQAKPVSVMEKSEKPPSGDKHDYMSVGPYWWPDTTKPNGVPYIRRDGEVNPEHDSMGDRTRLGAMFATVRTLALAYFVSRNEEFAARACDHVRVWFLDPATKMNPNLRYAQAIKGIVEGRGIGIIDTYGFRELIDAMQLLNSSEHWTPAIDKGMKAWFTEYLDWLLTSPNGREESAARNNHGTTYDVQVSIIALYLNKPAIAKEITAAAGTKRIAAQIEADGSQPLELERTKSWGYSVMNTEALENLALLAERVNVDLWHWSSEDGRSIQKAIDYLLPYALREKEWTRTQIAPFDRGRMYLILKIAAIKLDNREYWKASSTFVDERIRSSRAYLSWPHEDQKIR